MSDDRKIEAVIFDMDGVLTDSEPLINAAAVAMLPGAVELVRACRNAGLKVALASSADRIKIDANLKKIGLPPELWDTIVTAEDVVCKKPAPEVFLVTARRLGLAPDRCVVIEDAVNGVQAAKAAGMRCLAVAQTFSSEQLQPADLVKQNVSEISVDDLVGRPVGGSRAVVVPPLPIPALPQSAQDAPTQSSPWGFWATMGLAAAVAVAYLAAQTGVFVVWIVAANSLGQELASESQATNGLFVALATCGTMPVAVGMVWLFAWLRKGISVKEYLALNPLSWRATAGWSAALAGLVVLSDGLTILLHRPLVPEVMVQTYQTAKLPALLWLAVVVAAPLGEEAFFRGFIFKGILHSRLGGAGAIILTALIWAAIHQQYDLYGVANVFVAGLLFGFARLKTNSIYASLLMHALMNLIATIEVAAVIRSGGGSN